MSIKMNRRAFLGTALTFGALCSIAPAEAYGVTAAEKKAEVQAIKEKLDAMTDELDQAVDSYNKANSLYKKAQDKVDSCQAKITAAQKKIDSLQGRLGSRATSMYRSGSMSYLDVLLGVGTFGDFATVWDTLNSLNEDDADLVTQTKSTKSELENAKKELDEQKAEAKAQLAEAKSYQAQIQSKTNAYESEYNSLSSEYKTLLKKEEEAQAAAAEQAASTYTPNTSSSSGGSSSGGGSSSSSGGSNGSSIPTNGSVVDYAQSRLGCPYVWGAEGPNAFDCSGLTMWCYAKVGIGISHYTEAQLAEAKARISVGSAAPGDVLYNPGHVAISTGGGNNYIHAPQRGDVVRYGSGHAWQCALRF